MNTMEQSIHMDRLRDRVNTASTPQARDAAFLDYIRLMLRNVPDNRHNISRWANEAIGWANLGLVSKEALNQALDIRFSFNRTVDPGIFEISDQTLRGTSNPVTRFFGARDWVNDHPELSGLRYTLQMRSSAKALSGEQLRAAAPVQIPPQTQVAAAPVHTPAARREALPSTPAAPSREGTATEAARYFHAYPGGVIEKNNEPALQEINRDIQQRLVDGGFMPATNARGRSNVDGVIGNVTERAIKQFQQQNQLPVTGVIKEADMQRLAEITTPLLGAPPRQAAAASASPAASQAATPQPDRERRYLEENLNAPPKVRAIINNLSPDQLHTLTTLVQQSRDGGRTAPSNSTTQEAVTHLLNGQTLREFNKAQGRGGNASVVIGEVVSGLVTGGFVQPAPTPAMQGNSAARQPR